MSPETRAELVGVAEEMILDVLRDEPLIPFHKDHLGQHVGDRWAKSKAGDEALTEPVNRAIFQEACERVNARLPSAEAKPHNFTNSDSFWGVHLDLRPGREWVDVLRELHGPTVDDPARVLTYSATQILERVESGEFTREFLSEQSVRHRIRRFGFWGFDDVIRELEVKRGLKLTVERKQDTKAKRHRVLLKFHVVERAKEPLRCPDAPNPVFHYTGERAGLDLAFRRFFQQQLLQLQPPKADSVRFWVFDSLKGLRRCFPDWGDEAGKYSDRLSDLLSRCAVHPDTSLYWDLSDKSPFWEVGCQVQRPWSELLPEIRSALEEPDVAERFGLSAEAANLLRWVLNQPKESLLMGCTPLVEEAIRKRKLRLGDEWPSENLSALIEVLCEEITALTPYVLKPVGWKTSYWGGQVETRVRIIKNRAPIDVTDLVLRWVESKGVRRTPAEVRLALEKLSDNGAQAQGSNEISPRRGA